MKKTLPFFALAIVIISALTGCYKQTQYTNSMSATIDSIPFSATGAAQVSFYVDTFTHNPQMVDVTAQTTVYFPGTAVQPNIKLVVPNLDGTYAISSQVTATVITPGGTTHATSGQIVVLNTNNGRIQGNFSFTCADGTTVTNGQYTGLRGYH